MEKLADIMKDFAGKVSSYYSNIESTVNQISEYPVTPSQFGAVGDGAADDAPAFNRLLTAYGSNPVTVFLNKVYRIKSNIDLPANYHLIGINGARVVPDANVQFNAANMERIEIDTPFHGYYTDGSRSDLKIKDTKITADGYGILLNNNAQGSNFEIINNRIDAGADAIEINTTAGNFSGIKIIGNSIAALGDSTDAAAGFAVGIAKGKDIVVSANIIEQARNEAVHIEDAQERVIVSDNVIKDCSRDGVRLLNRADAKPIILTNNHIKKRAGDRSGTGIYAVYDPNGTLTGSNLTGNVIEGFNIGLDLGADAVHHIGGSTILDCNTAVSLWTGRTSGTIFSGNCPVLAQGGPGSRFGKIISLTEPAAILQYTGTQGYQGTTLEGFSFKKAAVTTSDNGYTDYTLFPLPTAFDGKLLLKYADNFDRIYYTADVTYSNGSLTINRQWSANNGVTAAPNLKTINNNLAVNFYSAASRQVGFDIDFEGVFYQE
ncbi:right-handed parallel beta-helix repeat-containing protein [Sporolactobacillus sp. KGMB 08714]|uniref:right-handed parallel beta-helix repeat-containing protein n=1 Tax=Sporolactobacillus sp. KGMB 08714 TaxID=3064704 RepID=UPI002FBD6BAA